MCEAKKISLGARESLLFIEDDGIKVHTHIRLDSEMYTALRRPLSSVKIQQQQPHSKCDENRILLKSMQSKAIKTMKKQNKLKFISVDDFIHRQLVWLSLAPSVLLHLCLVRQSFSSALLLQ